LPFFINTCKTQNRSLHDKTSIDYMASSHKQSLNKTVNIKNTSCNGAYVTIESWNVNKP